MQNGQGLATPTRRQRRWHSKVSSGCLTCKRRRVKCDEQKPSCRSCIRLRLTCRGVAYESPQSSQIQFHVTTPRLYKAKQSEALQCRYSNSTTCSLPPISTILGTSRCDLFSTAGVTDVSTLDRRNLYHAIVCQWLDFKATDKQKDLSLVRLEVMSHALNDPVARNTIIYLGATHHAFWAKEPVNNPQEDPTLLSLKNRAIHSMIEALKDRSGQVDDTMLFSMVCLAGNGSGPSVQRVQLGKVESRKTLLKEMDARLYGTLDPELEHLQAFYKLLECRGGMQSIHSPSVQVVMMLNDIWNSWKLLRPPRIPLLQSLSGVLNLRTWSMDGPAKQLYQNLTASLSPLIRAVTSLDCDAILCGIEAYRALTADLNYLRRIPKAERESIGPNHTVLWSLRETAMHALLCLPEYTAQVSGFTQPSTAGHLIHELCRMSLLMYAQVWLHPITNKGVNMARKLASRMQPLLVVATSRFFQGQTLSGQYPDFFLWTVILSLMCAYEDWDITGEIDGMESISPFILETKVRPAPESWPEISDVLERFLWARFECELTGKEAWQQACAIISPSPLYSGGSA